MTPPERPTPAAPTRTMLMAQAAARHASRRRPKSGIALITIGTLVLLVALAFDALGRDVTLWLWVGVGIFFIFAGYFARDPKEAIKGGTFVVNGIATLGAAFPSIWVRKGRRADDPVVQMPVIPDTPSTEFPAMKPGEAVPVNPTDLPPPSSAGEKGD